ncbi:MAG: ABC transporter permease [Acidimicrobiia bacterium]|nr:ABC transporter permease [Acidimicrobiia bacterium]MDH3470696.1 ABC transporter permease [Acidimicrobiia bacterium]
MTLSNSTEEVAVNPKLERAAQRRQSWRGFLTAVPAYAYLIFFFVLPLFIVFVFSFASRSRTGRPELENWNVDGWTGLTDPVVRTIVGRSLWIATLNTVFCLVIGYAFAYWIATRPKQSTRTILLILVLIPFWSNFLVRTYAWRMLLDSDGYITQLGEMTGLWGRMLFTEPAVFLGLLYGYLPFMVLPLYAAIERIDWSLVEAGRDLYASGTKAFLKITLPLSKPGIIAGSILVFIPSLGAYVTPDILGGAKTTLLGNYIVTQFGAARNWPFGSALSGAILIVMLGATIIYFRTGARTI